MKLTLMEFWSAARGRRTLNNIALERHFCRGEQIKDLAKEFGIDNPTLHSARYAIILHNDRIKQTIKERLAIHVEIT